jgi:2-keto-4-pentenoate hydratase/2-oxohepta-3-ene-1,7-dioic acid hydratase in catechol pathway
MKLVTFDDGRVGKIVDGRVVELDVTDMRRYFEFGGEVGETGRELALEDVRLRAPIVPKKFFHTAGNFREHHEESKNVNWSHPVLPWIVFFQNVDAIIGHDDAIIYPEALTSELDYELELAVVIGKAGPGDSVRDGAPVRPARAGTGVARRTRCRRPGRRRTAGPTSRGRLHARRAARDR